MFSTISSWYNDADKYVSKIIEDSIDDTSVFFKNYFNDDNSLKIENSEDNLLRQLAKINASLEKLDINNNLNWDSQLIYTATSLGHINEEITKYLCEKYDIFLPEHSGQSFKINKLKTYLSKIIINDLYFINTFRNSILHHNDFDYDLFNLDNITRTKLFNESKTAIAKTHFIYKSLNITLKGSNL